MKDHLLTLLIITCTAATSLHSSQKVSPWLEWSRCSRTCGVGVQSRTRSCPNGRGLDGGSLTCGDGDAADEYRLCNQNACPPGSHSFRSIQCAAYNNRQVAGRFVERWLPVKDHWGCELKCRSVDYGVTYTFGKAENGTRCSPEGVRICIHGRCTVVGCDHILGSNKNLDVCGLCGGRNDTCKRIADTFTEPRPTSGDWLRQVVTIPAGSTHIRVLDSTANRLVVQDVHGRSLLNYEKHYSWPGTYPVAGSQMEYQFTWNNETITINGPTNQDLNFLVRYGMGEGARVIYEFYQPIKSSPTTTILPPLAEVSTRSSARKYRGSKENRRRDDRGRANNKQRQPVTEKKTARLTNDRKASRQNRTRSSGRTNSSKKSHGRKHCPPCKKVKNMQQHFCDSDFVIDAKVKGHQVLGGEIRYELRLLRSYKNVVGLRTQEYVWAPDGKCRCPKLRPHRDYVIMGHFDPAYSKRESRLVVDRRSFVRRVNERREVDLLRVARQQTRNCNRIA